MVAEWKAIREAQEAAAAAAQAASCPPSAPDPEREASLARCRAVVARYRSMTRAEEEEEEMRRMVEEHSSDVDFCPQADSLLDSYSSDDAWWGGGT